MGGTLLLGQKSYIWDIIHTSSKISKFHIEKFWALDTLSQYETDYILEVWEKDCYFKKDTDICMTI